MVTLVDSTAVKVFMAAVAITAADSMVEDAAGKHSFPLSVLRSK